MSRRRGAAGALPLLILLALGATAYGRRSKGLSLTQLREIAARAGFPDVDVAAAIAMAESGGRPDAVGDSGISRGLWQINIAAHPQMLWQSLFDPDENARVAFQISKGGTDWTPWSVYRDGSYKRYLGGSS